MNNELPLITVITVTKNRPKLLERAINTVKNQTYPNIKHFIVIDDCPETLRMLEKKYKNDKSILWEYHKREKTDKSGPNILSKLRTYAIHKVGEGWFSFLDDDNEFYSNHLEELYLFAIKEKCSAVHSNREVMYKDGTPYLKQEWPWGRTYDKKIETYNNMLKAGVVEKGSNIWHDKFGFTVDTNVWLLRAELFCDVKIPSEYSIDDYEECRPEDEKMMELLIKNNVKVLSNDKATVKYYLGGYSNESEDPIEGTVKWEK
ncbi:MAG: glycosyltransferase family A protein [bacterium]|nr:glycosyltransferase family A protein [bacterium]